MTHINSANNGAPLKTEAVENQRPPPRATTSPLSNGSAPHTSTTASWSIVGKAPAASKTIDISSTKKAPARKYYLMNRDSQRIDEPLPRVDPAVDKRFHDRMSKEGKFCNNYHLNNACRNPECPFVHGEKLSPSELVVLKQKSRGILCSMGSDCVDINCFSGHHCRWLRDCTHSYCRFEGYHNIDNVRLFFFLPL
ncbi:hypothetical protein CTA2_1003, partial [Colletotrichum tanaceti]